MGNDITYFSYDEQGKMIGEYDKDGKLIREYIYLNNQPIGFFTQEKSGELLQIHTDHLGTPRAVSNAKKEILWRWEGDAFGDVQPQIQKIKLPLRMAGQYFDAESGLFYNWHRYYIPELGRYNRADPIGLRGGLNTFGYVGGNPLAYTKGLVKWTGGYGEASVGIKIAGIKGIHFFLTSECDDKTEKKYSVNVMAVGAGITIDASLFGPFSVGAGSVTLYDSYASPNPQVFNGRFVYMGGGTIIAGISAITLGGATGTATGWGISSDIGVIELVAGRSWVIGTPKEEECECES